MITIVTHKFNKIVKVTQFMTKNNKNLCIFNKDMIFLLIYLAWNLVCLTILDPLVLNDILWIKIFVNSQHTHTSLKEKSLYRKAGLASFKDFWYTIQTQYIGMAFNAKK